MKLTVGQIKIIQDLIHESHVEIRTLSDDLLDHLCCSVEQKMKTENDFEQALTEALQELSPAGLYSIQKETEYLINYDKMLVMKKTMYLIGLLSAMAIVSGICFTVLGYRGMQPIGNYGFLAFVFIFVPFQVREFYRTEVQRPLSDKLKFIFGFISGAFLAFARIFKTFHYQGASELLMAGTLLLVFGFLPFYFFSMYKKAVASA